MPFRPPLTSSVFPPYPVEPSDWTDWRWQMRHRVHDEASLERYVAPTGDERAAIAATRGIFRWNLEGSVSTR